MDPAETKQSVENFRLVRDIPYHIGLNANDSDYCCATKPKLLQALLQQVGITSRRILCTFAWADTPVPERLWRMAPEETDTHEYLEVLNQNKGVWVTVDPNWDRALKAAGFTISEWDGVCSTAIGVSPIETYSPEDSLKLILEEDELDPQMRIDYLKANEEFFRALNEWLRSVRQYS